jgi:multidrug resistance efflux pump
MRSEQEGKSDVAAIESRFSEIEKRVRLLVNENKGLKVRVSELEQQLAQARREAQQVEHLHGKKLHIEEKIERILRSLETAQGKE